MGMSWCVLVLAAGCGKSVGGGGGGGSAAPVARADFAPQAAKTFCDSFADCCNAQSYPVNAQTCTSQLSSYFEQAWLELGQKTVYDAQAAGDCLAALRAHVQCGSAEDDVIEAACERVFRGNVKLGQPCDSSNECEQPANGHARCDQADINSVQGVCTLEQAGVHAKAGEGCIGSCSGGDCDSIALPSPGGGDPQPAVNSFCYRAEGLYCGIDQVCIPLAQAGEPCEAYEGCADGLFCASDTSTCSARRPDGSACESDSNCLNGDCNGGFCQARQPDASDCANGSPFKNND